MWISENSIFQKNQSWYAHELTGMAQSAQELHTLTITFVLWKESGKMSHNHKAISIWKVLAKRNPVSQMGCHWLYQPHFRADMGFCGWLLCVFMLSFSFVYKFLSFWYFLYYFFQFVCFYFHNLFCVVVLLCFWDIKLGRYGDGRFWWGTGK